MALLPSDPQAQKRLLAGVVPLLLVFAYVYFFHGKARAEVQGLETRLEELEQKNSTARVAALQGGPELEKKLALYEQHMGRLEELIPASEEVPQLLEDVSTQAREAGVDLNMLRPQPETPGPYYTLQSYELSVIGSYHRVGRFLSSIGSLARIITPVGLKLKPTGEKDR
ncbi:MAG: type 4a pilus biogenesis protein PilO, partial [Gemmatimonadetes bacterium]|nr:type 4a pilus biogenesis protein PilO [Gemmatimonadota bacterium]